MKNVLTRRFKRPFILLIFLLLLGVNACRKQEVGTAGFGRYNSYKSGALLQPEEIKNWLKTLPAEFYQDVYIDKAQQSVINRRHVVRIPIGKDAALFFTKDNDSLKVFLYKWQDKQPGAKKFTGNLVSYSFQDRLLRTLIYQQGKVTSYREYNQPLFLKSAYWHNNNATGNMLYSLWGKITNREIIPPAPKMTFQPVLNHIAVSTTTAVSGGVLSKLWCWLTGGTWGPVYGAQGEVLKEGCNRGGGDEDDEEAEEAAIDWMQDGFIGGATGDFYVGANNNPTNNIGSDGSGINTLPPYGGGDVWITIWVQDPKPDGCDVPGGGDQPPSSTIDDSSGGCDGGGHWETYRLNVPANTVIPSVISDFSSLDAPTDTPEEPIINNGISAEVSNDYQPSSGRVIAHTINRNNTEDMGHGRGADLSGITTSEISKTDEQLFSGMTGLIHGCTFFDGGLKNVGDLMIQKFRDGTSGPFENNVLSSRVGISSQFLNFAKVFGDELNTELRNHNGDINNISNFTIDNKYRPTFNGLYNKFHGLQILINDTEQTNIQLDVFNPPVNGHWSAVVTITITDHFGLDKHDALTYQGNNLGFPDWWLLQHDRDYKPFITVVRLRVTLSGNL